MASPAPEEAAGAGASAAGREGMSAPSPLPTTFVDDGLGGIPIGVGGGSEISPGFFRYPNRLRVRYTADTPLDLSGTVLLVDPGVGASGVARYDGTVTGAPTAVTVLQDDGAALRDDLDLATTERARIQWTGATRTPQLTVRLPAIEVKPYGTGVDIRIDDVPERLGFDWAQRSDVLWLVVRQGLTLAAIGAVAGAAGAFALGRTMSSLLFGVSAADTTAFVVALAVALGTAVVACFLPARRAAALDPLKGLRAE